MDRKTMPLFLMLIAGAVTILITFIRGYTVLDKLTAFLIAMVVFYTLGFILRCLLDHFDRQNELLKAEEGEVIEKELEEEQEEEQDEEQNEEQNEM